MNSAQGSLSELCENERLDDMLQSYLELCAARKEDSESVPTEENQNKKRQKARGNETSKASFPNLAGFCRYLGVGTDELEQLAAEYPTEHGKILAVLEDEALNSGLSATLISAYLKKRLGYGNAAILQTQGESQMQIRFEHDIIEDGE